jgi:hypothetical protein
MERDCGRIALRTPGNGNCWFNAVASELLRLRLLGDGRRRRAAAEGTAIRALVADEATRHVAAMRSCRGAWERSTARSKRSGATPRLEPENYASVLRQPGTWATHFDVALTASVVLALSRGRSRLVVLRRGLARPCVHHPPWSGDGQSSAVPTTLIAAAAVVEADVVVRLSALHYTACPPGAGSGGGGAARDNAGSSAGAATTVNDETPSSSRATKKRRLRASGAASDGSGGGGAARDNAGSSAGTAITVNDETPSSRATKKRRRLQGA